MTPVLQDLNSRPHGHVLMGKMTFRRAKCFAKVVHTIETCVLNIQTTVRIRIHLKHLNPVLEKGALTPKRFPNFFKSLLIIIIIIMFIIPTINPKRQSLLVTKDSLRLFSASNNLC